ncbi:beta-galactosidase GalB [Rosettibacter firmus]|uniref:beta-galactosidase GalB n=1 Tax=Rosettibacter firmus TaxID=3111522 RepID=UPI00336BD8D3
MKKFFIVIFLLLFVFTINAQTKIRIVENFCKDWKFHLGDIANGNDPSLNDNNWRLLNLPHDWSIEGEFSKDHPATPGGGALPGGIGWYRKSFFVSSDDKEKLFFIDFDGVYRNSEVWINGNYLGKRPYGYSSFRYELTPYLKFGEKNIIAVKVDNSLQPNSRWYSGSGIYRNVWLVKTNKVFVDHWGTYITTPVVNKNYAKVSIQIKVRNRYDKIIPVGVKTRIINSKDKIVAESETLKEIKSDSVAVINQEIEIANPELWSIENPELYKALTIIEVEGKIFDDYETTFGIRTFEFHPQKGFFLNGKHVKIKGVCNHHDLGCLGAAINERAIERQLEIMKAMGVNAIRTSHNPPAPELLNLCDKMGFIVMDEAFDMWKTKKTEYDYAMDWDKWYKRDLEDMILRDRNHPSIFIWSIGNEVMEQWIRDDSIGIVLTKELTKIVKNLDPTRPVTAACNGPEPENPLIKADVLDLIGFNYHHHLFEEFPKTYPGKKFIATETTSALATRGHYDMPSDSIRRWPKRWDLPLEDGNPDNTCSAYDNCSAPWGSTHEETWKIIKKHDFLSGMFIWTGFDYLGEPTPYSWPSRSSYFGIVDLAGFPKDVYYMYQSEWTDKPVLHVFPHWNWKEGQIIDVWAYTNCDEVELFLNGNSLGTKRKTGDDLHLMWRIKFSPGVLKAIGRKNGKEILVREIKTAKEPYKIALEADRKIIKADGKDLSFVTVKILDENNTLVPYADNLVNFEIEGEGKIIGVDNGSQTSHEPFKANYRRAFNGLCLVVIQSNEKPGKIKLTAKSENLLPSTIELETR